MTAKIPYEEIIEKIKTEKGLSKEEIEDKIKSKISALSGLVSKQGAAYIIANELGIKFFEAADGDMKIKSIYPGMRNIKTVAKIAKKIGMYEFERNGAKGKVASFTIADETGSIRLTGWHEQAEFFNKTTEGDIIKFTNAFVKENNGQKELHLTNNSNVSINPPGVKVDVNISGLQGSGSSAPKQYNNEKKHISELKEGDVSVELFVTIVDAFDIRFYEVCPECNKRTINQDGSYFCDAHGAITPIFNYVMNIVIDDGTDTIRTVLFKNQITKLLKKSDEELQAIRENSSELQNLKDNILGETVRLIGKVSKNSMYDRLEFVANLVFMDVNIDDEIKNFEGKDNKKTTAKKVPSATIEEEIED